MFSEGKLLQGLKVWRPAPSHKAHAIYELGKLRGFGPLRTFRSSWKDSPKSARTTRGYPECAVEDDKDRMFPLWRSLCIMGFQPSFPDPVWQACNVLTREAKVYQTNDSGKRALEASWRCFRLPSEPRSQYSRKRRSAASSS